MSRWKVPSALVCAMALAASAPQAVAEDAQAPIPQDALDEWWSAAGKLWTSSTAYQVEDVRFRDGVCSLHFKSGSFIPVYSGRLPVSERLVGVVFQGEGTMRVQFPERSDAWRFANHMVMRADQDPAEYGALAHAGASYETNIDRGLILSADPKVRKLLVDQEPYGSGVVIREGKGKLNEEYIITDNRGGLVAKLTATNLLPNRRELLVKSGLDPSAMLRQDRLLNEEFGLPGRYLRSIMDFHTDEAYRIASQTGKVLAPGGYDEWLTCFRDGLDQAESGYKSIAFSHGIDTDDNRRWERFSGQPYADPDAGEFKGAPVRMDAVAGDATVTAQPAKRGLVMKVQVESTIELRAVGGNLQYAMLSLPVGGALDDSFELDQLALADGRPVSAVALREDLSWGKLKASLSSASSEASSLSDLGSDSVSMGGGNAGGLSTGESISADTSDNNGPISTMADQFENDSVYDSEGYSQQERKQEILVVLPEPVMEGDTVELALDWHATWKYANWSTGNQVLGTTTGPQRFLPELLPSQGGTRWDFKVRVGTPGVSLRSRSVALSGDTVREWVDDDMWPWVEAEGVDARSPTVAIGQWQDLNDPPALGLPAVRVHLAGTHVAYLEQFPPEARRVVSYLQRFLPAYPQAEVEIYQGPSTFQSTALRRGMRTSVHGLVGVSTVKTNAVGDTSELESQNQYLSQTMIARQITSQYWGQLIAPATARDLWLPDALSDAYAAFYIRSAFGNEAYEDRMKAVRGLIEKVGEREGQADKAEAVRNRRFLSLTGATDLSDINPKLLKEYGLYVLGDMVRLRIGDQPYFFALDRLAERKSGQRVTTDELQQAFESASGQNLSEFFDYWVHGGYLPEITVETRIEEQADGKRRVHGCILSDIPFGRFEIPIQVSDTPDHPEWSDPKEAKSGRNSVKTKDDKDGTADDRSVSALVDVDDGRGHFIVPDRVGEVTVEADPLALVLAYQRKVKEGVDATTCEQEGLPRFTYGKATVRDEFVEYDRDAAHRAQGLEQEDDERGADKAIEEAGEGLETP